MRNQIIQDKAELRATSSQDEFAKWARLRRKIDKAVTDLETLSLFSHFSLFHRLMVLSVNRQAITTK